MLSVRQFLLSSILMTWSDLSMPLPLILAGPVLRRVEPGMVSVWIALREAADITLSLWLRGQVHSGTEPGAFSGPRADFVSAPQATVRIAENLHVVVVTLMTDLLDPIV